MPDGKEELRMDLISLLNSPVLYLICGGIILFVAVTCIVFAVRAYRAGRDKSPRRSVPFRKRRFTYCPKKVLCEFV